MSIRTHTHTHTLRFLSQLYTLASILFVYSTARNGNFYKIESRVDCHWKKTDDVVIARKAAKDPTKSSKQTCDDDTAKKPGIGQHLIRTRSVVRQENDIENLDAVRSNAVKAIKKNTAASRLQRQENVFKKHATIQRGQSKISTDKGSDKTGSIPATAVVSLRRKFFIYFCCKFIIKRTFPFE